MLNPDSILLISTLKTALENLPVLTKYYEKDIPHRIPVLFAMYARHKDAELFFDGEGRVSGYAEPQGGGDPALKALHILSVEYFMDEEVCRDIKDFWQDLKQVDFRDSFPYILCSYLVSGTTVDRYSQADESILSEIEYQLSRSGAERIYEETGRFGALGDGYHGWRDYSIFIHDAKERFVDGFARTLNGDPELHQPKRSLIRPAGPEIKSFDTVILNLAREGGLSGDDGKPSTTGLVDDLVGMRLLKTEMDLRRVILVTDLDFCESDRYRLLREKLLFYKLVDSVSFVHKEDTGLAIVVLDFTASHDELVFRDITPSNPDRKNGIDRFPHPLESWLHPNRIPERDRVNSFAIPYSMVLRNGGSLLPQSYLEEKSDDGFTEYRVALVGHLFNSEARRILENNHIAVSCEVDSISGADGLEARLLEDSQRPLRTIHAVVIDAWNGYDENHPFKYVGLFNVTMLTTDVPVFIRSDNPVESFGEHLACLIATKKDRIFFIEGEGMSSIRALASELRERLDARPPVDASVLARYHDEIDAAEWLDPTGEVTRLIAKALKEEFDVSNQPKDTQDKLNGLRKCAEAIFRSDAAKDMLPPLNTLGEHQRFLMDGEYYDKNKKALYVLNDPGFIPDALNASFEYFVDMTNAASHTADERNVDVSGYMSETRRPGIYKSCVSILLDLLCWFRSTCINSTRKRYEIRGLIEETDVVQKSQMRDYYYIGRVHLLYKNGLRTDLPASAIRLKTVALDKYRINDKKTEGVRYYAKPADYDIVE